MTKPSHFRSNPTFRRPWAAAGSVAGLAAFTLAGLYLTYAYVPRRQPPALGASVVNGQITVGGHERRYVAVVPRNLPPNTPLLFVFHGSMQDGRAIREATGYGFDQLAERHSFVVVYPDAYKGGWNDCRTAATFPARTENIDDEALVSALIARLHQEHGIDPSRVFAAGYSNGGQMVLRLAAEQAGSFAGLAAIAATQPTADNFSCTAPGQPVPMLLMGGTRDPIVPYGGGVISLFGFQPRGTALSFADTARYFARQNGITSGPSERALLGSTNSSTSVTELSYAQADRPPVVAYTVQGGGHVVPGPRAAFPRLVGAVDRDLDAPEVIWQFFAGLPARSRAASQAGE